MAENQHSILVVEDDPDVAAMLHAYFHVQGYEVTSVNWGEDAVQACRASRPDLIILDIRLPDIDGYEVARRLRASRRTEDIPIIFLTEKRARADRIQGLELGADDYITKPFDIQELRLRVRNALRRYKQGPLNNPVTSLPEAPLVDERLLECLEGGDWALLLVSLKNLDAFREAYGFVASDDVLRAVSLMIQNAVRDLGSPSDFIGQYAPTDFLLVASSQTIAPLAERIRGRLDLSLEYFYPLKDRSQPGGVTRRLGVHMVRLESNQGPFDSLDDLKSRLAA
ncbi:MAG: response regulator [Chloroflexi bacterium]|nr:response regulator [Chloroflexota bacterium]